MSDQQTSEDYYVEILDRIIMLMKLQEMEDNQGINTRPIKNTLGPSYILGLDFKFIVNGKDRDND
jgi:hypothetical protein